VLDQAVLHFAHAKNELSPDGVEAIQQVAKVLADAGIPVASMQTVGAGPDQPIADNATPEG